MQTRRKNTRSKRGQLFSSFNNESDNYESDEDVELNSLQNHILQTKHPFELNGLTDNKPISVLQKAITYFIKKNGGWANENKIFQFLNDKWTDIMQISKKHFQNKPKVRLLHVNLSAKKKGQHLFVRRTPTSSTFRINYGDGINPSDLKNNAENEDSTEEEEYNYDKDSQYSEEEDESNEAWNNIDPDSMTFETCIIKVLQANEKPMTENEIIKKVSPYSNQKGLYMNLNVNQRVRACLITLKISREVFVIETNGDDKWSLQIPVRNTETTLFENERYNPFIKEFKESKVNLDVLLERCRNYKNKCFL